MQRLVYGDDAAICQIILVFLNISLFVSLRVHVNDAVKFRYRFDIH